MQIQQIEQLSQQEDKWINKNKPKEYKSINFILKVLSFFSVIFSLSIIGELFILGIPTYIVVIFSIFLFLIIVANEYIKVNKLIDIFSFNNNLENKILSTITVTLSIIVSTYGIYKFLDRTETKQNQIKEHNQQQIQDNTYFYTQKIDSMELLTIDIVKPYSDKLKVFQTQLNQYNLDRNNVSNIKNNDMRSYYVDINNKIDKINSDIVVLTEEFDQYKKSIINEYRKELEESNSEILLNQTEEISVFNNKNNIIIGLFLFFTILTELGIIYVSNKIGLILKYNKEVEDENEKINKEKITYIKNTSEYKNYMLYKTLLEKIFTSKVKGNAIIFNEFKTILKNYNLKQNDIEHIMEELRAIGILGPSIKRVGSCLELDFDDSLLMLRKYYEPFFNKF